MIKKNKGFTLVELLVVIAILAVLGGAAIVGYTTFIKKADESNAKSELTQIKKLIISNDIDNDEYKVLEDKIDVKPENWTKAIVFSDLKENIGSIMFSKVSFTLIESDIEVVNYEYSDSVYAYWKIGDEIKTSSKAYEGGSSGYNNGQEIHTDATQSITIGDNGHWFIDGTDTGVSAKGEKGDSGSSFLNGTTAPSDSLGKDGDSYLDYSSWDFYTKEAGTWTKRGNIKNSSSSSESSGSSSSSATTPTKNSFVFTLLDNGTYSIKAATSNSVTSNLIIPETYNGVKITEIGSYAFYNSTNIKTVTITDNIIKICSNAFKGCSSITSIYIPSSVTSIGNDLIDGCTSLKNIVVSEKNEIYDSRENCNAIIRTFTNTMLYACNTSFIPSTVTSIGENAFCAAKNLESITIPSGVTSIGSFAFSELPLLKSVNLHDGITHISDAAFSNCSSLTTISIPTSLTSIGINVFFGCPLKSIFIPGKIKKINFNSFSGTALESITVSTENEYYDSRDNCNAIIDTYHNSLILGCKNTVIPNTVNQIDQYAFRNCKSLSSIIIPDNVNSIGYEAFYGCSSLTSIVIPSGVTYIGSEAFNYCSNLTIYIDSDSIPTTWNSAWNIYNCPVKFKSEWNT